MVSRRYETPPADNLTWAPDGRLLVAVGLSSPWKMMQCTRPEEGNCPGAFAILALDPEDGSTETLYTGGPGTPSGHGTVGLKLADQTLLTGTFAGDRIVVFPATP